MVDMVWVAVPVLVVVVAVAFADLTPKQTARFSVTFRLA
jgi:hypothetical protein